MSVIEQFNMIAVYLIEVMGGLLVVALVLRYIAYRSSQRDKVYFNSFAKSTEKLLEGENKYEQVDNVSDWLTGILEKIVGELPERSLRFGKTGVQSSSFREGGRESFSDFAHGKRSIIHSVKQQIDAFKSPYPPNFVELTDRVLSQDKKWCNVLGFIPVNTLSRVLDILPGLFIVGGIFGTFIGITAALPMIAQIDLSNLDAAGPILNQFVDSVAFSMNTSISGIIYSVVMTVLNTVFRLHHSRRAVSKNLENCFQSIWYRIHGSKISAGEKRMIELLEVIAGKGPVQNRPAENSQRIA